MSDCCTRGFCWDGNPKGREATVASNATYVTGSNSEVAILVIHDLFGWTFPNIRLLADAYAEEVNATVYVPDL
jgi:dienelactone hydrolase